jgi:molybdopterin synthase sulfur carrier subunit
MAEPVTVLLPEALRRLFPGAPQMVEVAAGSVAEAIDGLDRRWPGMRDRLCDSTPAIRRHLNIFVEGERARLDSAIPPGGEMIVMTWISGG